jgi:uncharacterized protein (DUF849 family)
VLIKACLNGSRQPAEHPALPVTPDQLAADALACRRAGAGAVHVHPRDADGRETLQPEPCGQAITAIRTACPGLPVGLTTGLWIAAGNTGQRLKSIDAWTVLPDFCSVNFSEAGTEELCELLIDKGIDVEAGLTSMNDTLAFVGSQYANRCLRVLIEIQPGRGEPLGRAAMIHRMLDEAQLPLPRLQHGMHREAWPLLEDSLARGCDVRTGLEDTVTLPDGAAASSNAALVAVAVRLSSMRSAVG